MLLYIIARFVEYVFLRRAKGIEQRAACKLLSETQFHPVTEDGKLHGEREELGQELKEGRNRQKAPGETSPGRVLDTITPTAAGGQAPCDLSFPHLGVTLMGEPKSWQLKQFLDFLCILNEI